MEKTADQIYDRTRSMLCMVRDTADPTLFRMGCVRGWVEDKLIIGFDDNRAPIAGFNTSDHGYFTGWTDGVFFAEGSKSFTLEKAGKVLHAIPLASVSKMCRQETFIEILAEKAPIPLPKGRKVEMECGAGWCSKHNCECLLHFSHSCVNDYNCKLTREETKKEAD